MEENKVFKNIWRFNAIVIMLVGVLGVALTLFSCIMIYKDITRDQSVRNIVNIEDLSGKKEEWQLGRITSIQGSDNIMIPLHSDQKKTGSETLNLGIKWKIVSDREIKGTDLFFASKGCIL